MDTFLDVAGIVTRAKMLLNFRTDGQLAEYLGISRPALSNWLSRNSIDFPLVLEKFKDVDYNWLLLGKGSPKRSQRYIKTDEVEGEVNLIHIPKSVEKKDDRTVALYDISAAANLRTLFEQKGQYLLGEISIPNIPACDGAIHVCGDSMYPILKSGDIVGYKELVDFDEIIYGEMYIVSFIRNDNEYLAVKYVNRSERSGCIKLVSYNPHHEPKDISLTSVNAMALVKFSIRRHCMI